MANLHEQEQQQWIVVYRPHGDLMNETQHYGVFDDYLAAETFLCNLPAVGHYDEEAHNGRKGVKYVQPLIPVK